ncbi:MAG: hypothetical protein RR855_06605 [Comamonas sp.]
MSLWVFLLWIVLGIALAIFLARLAYHRLPAHANRKRLRYLQPYAPTPAPAQPSSQKGAACD